MGHGVIVDYDLDWMSARAGWALENVTFENFGFSEGVIDHDSLLRATIAGEADVPLENVVRVDKDLDAQQKSRMAAVQRAESWKEQSSSWNRADTVVEALRSQDAIRAPRALNWVPNGTTRCNGFDRQFVESRVLPISSKYIDAEMADFKS